MKWKLVDEIMILQNTWFWNWKLIRCGKLWTERTFYYKIARGKIKTSATLKTELPVTISNCCLLINIIKKRSIPDFAVTLNPSLVIAIQKSSNHHTVGLKSTSGKSFYRTLACIIDNGCDVSCILIFKVALDT